MESFGTSELRRLLMKCSLKKVRLIVMQTAARVLEKGEVSSLANVDCLSPGLAGPDSDGLLDW